MFGLLGRGAIEGMMDEDPRRQGLLSAALAGLSASGPSSKPVSLGQTLGMAGTQGLQTMREGQNFQAQREMRDMQMQQMRMQQTKMQEDMAQAAQQRQALQNFAAQLPESERTAFMANPQAFIAERNKKYTVGRSLVDGSGNKIFTADETPQLLQLPVPGQPGVTQNAWGIPGRTEVVNVGGMKMPEILNPEVQRAKEKIAGAGKTTVTVAPDNLGLKPKDRFDMEGKLADDYRNDPTVKAAQEMSSAFKLIETARMNPSPANDLAMATKYMKILDPTSVVRESELALALGATGVLDRVMNYANLIATGQKLNPKQREDFYNSAREINNTFQNKAKEIETTFANTAKQYNLSPANVTRYRPTTTAPRAPMLGTVRDGYKYKGGDPASPASWSKVN